MKLNDATNNTESDTNNDVWDETEKADEEHTNQGLEQKRIDLENATKLREAKQKKQQKAQKKLNQAALEQIHTEEQTKKETNATRCI
ncbi:MAG: hypothetical protein RCG15_04335 [Candidatus Rickettsia vulgarisii]